MQQGKISQAEMAIKTLFGKERVAVVMNDLNASSQGSSEPEAGWFDLFSSRYRKGIPENNGNYYLRSQAQNVDLICHNYSSAVSVVCKTNN